MSAKIVAIGPGETLAAARNLLREHHIHHLLVLDDGNVVGILAMRDLAGKPDATRVEEVMHREVATIDGDATLRRAASLMIRATTGCLPVMDDGKVAGVITTTDLMRVLNADSTLS